MRGWWQDLTDLVLPAECGGCGRPRTVLCPGCRAALTGDGPARVRPDPAPPGLPVVHAAAPYEDQVRATLLAHKERGALMLAGPLGAALAGAVRAGLGTGGRAGEHPCGADLRGAPVLLVPVPSARRAVRARGHDPARRIALAAAAGLRRGGTPARVLAVLRQRRGVADQSGLTARQRLDNLAGALEVAPAGRELLAGGGRIVLVDDLMTTGASLAEAARALRAVLPVLPERSGFYGRVTPGTAEEGTCRATAAGVGRAEAVREKGSANSAEDGIGAAVVAASPASFEINRN
ncbi:putative amidophosphoribosyltransferase [Streptomyces sp. V3I8]|uniref:ComF family protein n=1 Tax=Streptomyces sp. V3I8 TaxID=3042279 RepID=UPI00278B3C1B|nr:ComF family protein [Streptomyces sp. V3I8]MDQ1038257.1 putative amidophosphoribosyltransferase [Streptomyces sp. V3I8]